jgi:hypothetical protein
LATLNGGNVVRAEAFVRQLEGIARPDRPLERGMAHYCRCMVALVQGDAATALENGRAAVRIVEAEGVLWPQVHFTGMATWAMIEAGRLEEAQSHVDRVRALVSGTFLAAYEAEMALCEAAIGLARGDLQHCRQRMALACQLGRERQYLFMQRAMPPSLSRVWCEALRAGVESDFIREIIRRFGLWPGPPGDETWPWPLRVRILGGAHCIGTYTFVEGKHLGTGYCIHVDPDGDRWLQKWEAGADFSGTWTAVGGSGKYAGMQASGMFKPIGPVASALPNSVQQCNHNTGSYRLK